MTKILQNDSDNRQMKAKLRHPL